VFVFAAVRHNVLVNGTLKDTLAVDVWFTTGITVMASAVFWLLIIQSL